MPNKKRDEFTKITKSPLRIKYTGTEQRAGLLPSINVLAAAFASLLISSSLQELFTSVHGFGIDEPVGGLRVRTRRSDTRGTEVQESCQSRFRSIYRSFGTSTATSTHSAESTASPYRPRLHCFRRVRNPSFPLRYLFQCEFCLLLLVLLFFTRACVCNFMQI